MAQPVSDGPLSGKTVVVTRSRAQAAELTMQLGALGAEVLEFPVIDTVEPESWEPADSAIRNLETYNWVVFTSANAVNAFFDRMATQDMDARQLAGCRVAAVGPATATRCEERGVRPDFVPEEHRAEGVLDGLCRRGVGSGSRVLIPRALEAREVLPDTLREQGAHVDVVPVYRTVPAPGAPGVLERMAEGQVDAVTFTSSSTVRHFLRLLKGSAATLEQVIAVSIGPVTSETARRSGLAVAAEATHSTVAGLVQAIVDLSSPQAGHHE